jgi:hypothetical protein
MGPFYKTNSAASTICASRRTGNLAVASTAKNLMGESLSDAQTVASNSFNLLENANLHQGRKPASTGN